MEGNEAYEQDLEVRSAEEVVRLNSSAELGDSMDSLLRSPLGRALWKSAERDQVSIAMKMLDLKVDDPDFTAQFLALQAKALGGSKFIEYCVSISADGDAAFRSLGIGED